MSLTSVDLPEPETPVTAVRTPSGKETSMSRRLFSLAPITVSCRAGSTGRRISGTGMERLPHEVLAGDRLLVGEQLVQRTGVDDLAAVLTGARADVHDPVGDLDGVLVVLHHDQGVAHVAQADQGLDQPVVVALVEADRGLVQDVEHADQAGADLGGQPDALGLTAGEEPAGRLRER